MRTHDAVFLESLSGIALIVLWATVVFMVVLVVPFFLAMFLGYIPVDLNPERFLSVVFEIILGLISYQAIKFLNNFRENRILPYLHG